MVPIYEQLTDQIKNQILTGSLKEGEGLPSIRSLSADLHISALTVKKSYDLLEEEGFVQTVHGKGTFVAAADMNLAAEARKKSVENDFAAAVDKARALGLTDDEIREVLNIILDYN
jgi:GntR family transcriptional regulator